MKCAITQYLRFVSKAGYVDNAMRRLFGRMEETSEFGVKSVTASVRAGRSHELVARRRVRFDVKLSSDGSQLRNRQVRSRAVVLLLVLMGVLCIIRRSPCSVQSRGRSKQDQRTAAVDVRMSFARKDRRGAT